MPSWVYEIVQTETNKTIYVGSTTGSLFCLRRGGHTRPSNITSKRQPRLYGFIYGNGGWEKFHFTILREFGTIEKSELLTLEKQYIREKSPMCNVQNPIETHDEFLERRRIQSRQWRKDHPEYLETLKHSESNKRYVQKRCSTKVECPCGGVYTLQNKSNHFSRQIHKRYEDSQEGTKTPSDPPVTNAQ